MFHSCLFLLFVFVCLFVCSSEESKINNTFRRNHSGKDGMSCHVDIKAYNCCGSLIHLANGFGGDLSLVWFSLET